VNIAWSPLAIERILEIAAWIATDRRDAGEKLVEGIFAAVERLREFPESGRQVPEFERPELREVIYRKYRIIYRTESDLVEILTVRHSLQLLDEHDLGE
jgi:toxin ParE1/3/4